MSEAIADVDGHASSVQPVGDATYPQMTEAALDVLFSSKWGELFQALILLEKGAERPYSFHCEHDTFYVHVSPAFFTQKELEYLDELGFIADVEEDCFYSFTYGSA